MDGFVAQYNADRPHQALDGRASVTPTDRFQPVPQRERELLELLPQRLTPATEPKDADATDEDDDADVLPVRPK